LSIQDIGVLNLNTEKLDFDLHGIVGIRLLNATDRDIAAVKKQLGPIQSSLTREPDIIISFVDQIQHRSSVRYLGVDEVGFTDDAFLVFRGKHKARIKTQIPFDKIGMEQCQIICESGLPAVPLLMPIINLTALSKGTIPLHATSFNYNGKGVVVTGWSKGGKTEMLLAYAANGAEYVGDEWIYLSPDGECMFGIPEPIRIWYWHLQAMPFYKERVNRNTMFRLQTLNLFVKILEKLAKPGAKSISALSRLMGSTARLLNQQLYVQLPPEKLIGQTAKGLTGRPETIFFVGSHAEPDLTVQPMNPQEIAEKMVFSLQEERKEFMSYYLKYRFAFPNRINSFIDHAAEIQHDLLSKVLAGKKAYALFHPYPVSISSLFEVSHSYCD